MDSGAAKTISPKDMVPGLKPYRTKHTGASFRVANGKFIENQGEVALQGTTTNCERISVKSQVADVTRPLASTAEMVDSGNIVLMYKSGGIIKQVTPEQERSILNILSNYPGPSVPITRRQNVFSVEINVKSEGKEGDWNIATGRRAAKNHGQAKMEVDQVEVKNRYAAFWEDQPFQRQP